MMTDEEKEAIARLKTTLSFWEVNNVKNSDERIILNLLSKKDKELDKKDKVIDLMAEELTNGDFIGKRPSKNAMIEHYYKKVEEENG